jgi:hypothetical protein
MPSSAVIEQFIEYAKTEREAICECMEQLGDKYKDIPGYTRKGLPVVSEGAKIANYHKGKEGAEPQGVKFHSLQQLVVPKADGTVKTVTLVNNGKSAYENLKTANEEFFDKTPQEQAEIIALTLHQHTMLGVQKAKDLSIITTEDVSAIINNKQTVQHSATEEGIWNLQNINLDENQIRAVAEQFMKTPAFQQDIQAFPERTLYYNRLCRSLAIAAIIQDVETRSIICTEESLRCFIGNPAFFKGPEDIQKRIGGLVSTGDDNVTDLPGIKEEYTCAEMVNYETGSKSDIMKDLKKLMTEGEFREVYGNKFNDFENAFAKDKDGKYVISLEQIKKNLKELAGLSDK